MMNKLTEAIVLRRQPTPSLLIEILSILYFFIQHIGIWQVMKENTMIKQFHFQNSVEASD